MTPTPPRKIVPPTTLMDRRVPHPTHHDWAEVPEDVRAFCEALFRERNTCSDERVNEIDAILLHALRPFTRDLEKP